MRRIAPIVLLLVLLPLTMAPRTSLTPGPTDLDVQLIVSRTSLDPGQRLTVVLQTRNTTETDFTSAVTELSITWTGKAETLEAVSLPEGCSFANNEAFTAEYVVTCRLGPLASGKLSVVSFGLVPSMPGELVMRAGGVGTALDPRDRASVEVIVGAGTPPEAG